MGSDFFPLRVDRLFQKEIGVQESKKKSQVISPVQKLSIQSTSTVE